MNGNVIASFVEKRKVLRFCRPKKMFFCTYATLKPSLPPPPCMQWYAFDLTTPPPLCVRTMWMTLKIMDDGGYP